MRPEIRQARRYAIEAALSKISDGMVVGLGSGSTVAQFIDELQVFLRNNAISVKVIPSSYQTYLLAVENGFDITTLEKNPRPSLTIDSLDQTTRLGEVVKGGGGALTREKILCYAAEETILICDYSKVVEKLNTPIPVEVIPFAVGYVVEELQSLGGRPKIREGKEKVGPVISDNGNILIDVDFGELENPRELEEKLDKIPGVVENGIFSGCVDEIIVGYQDGKVDSIIPKK